MKYELGLKFSDKKLKKKRKAPCYCYLANLSLFNDVKIIIS